MHKAGAEVKAARRDMGGDGGSGRRRGTGGEPGRSQSNWCDTVARAVLVSLHAIRPAHPPQNAENCSSPATSDPAYSLQNAHVAAAGSPHAMMAVAVLGVDVAAARQGQRQGRAGQGRMGAECVGVCGWGGGVGG